jgi:hypothetical protein
MPSDSVSPLRTICAANLPNDLRASSSARRPGSGTHRHPPFNQKPNLSPTVSTIGLADAQVADKVLNTLPRLFASLASSPHCTLLNRIDSFNSLDALRLSRLFPTPVASSHPTPTPSTPLTPSAPSPLRHHRSSPLCDVSRSSGSNCSRRTSLAHLFIFPSID